MNLEGFEQIPGLPKGYGVTCNGIIRYKVFNMVRSIKTTTTKSGYKTFCRYINGKNKTVYIHKIVAMCFCENPNNKNTVNHKDGDKANNNYSNLEWVTKSEDRIHAIRVLGNKVTCNAHLRKTPITNGVKIYESVISAAEDLGILTTSMCNCLKGRTKTSGGHKWRYLII